MYVQGFYREYITFKEYVNKFECMEIAESIYESLFKPFIKNLLGNMPTVLVSAGKREDNTPRKIPTLRQVRALISTEKVCRSSKG